MHLRQRPFGDEQRVVRGEVAGEWRQVLRHGITQSVTQITIEFRAFVTAGAKHIDDGLLGRRVTVVDMHAQNVRDKHTLFGV